MFANANKFEKSVGKISDPIEKVNTKPLVSNSVAGKARKRNGI